MAVGQKIKELRERAGLTQEELAARIGVTASAVGNYESGRSHPKENVMYRLFGALGCEPNDIFEGYFDMEDSPQRRHMSKYLALDAHGKELVDMCTEIEYRRVCANAFGAAGDDTVLIAARKGGAPHRIEMKKRRGAGSILDMPDYKG